MIYNPKVLSFHCACLTVDFLIASIGNVDISAIFVFQFRFLCDISVLLISRLSSIFLDILGDCDKLNKRYQRKKVVDRYQLNVVCNLREHLTVVMSVVSQKSDTITQITLSIRYIIWETLIFLYITLSTVRSMQETGTFNFMLIDLYISIDFSKWP